MNDCVRPMRSKTADIAALSMEKFLMAQAQVNSSWSQLGKVKSETKHRKTFSKMQLEKMKAETKHENVSSRMQLGIVKSETKRENISSGSNATGNSKIWNQIYQTIFPLAIPPSFVFPPINLPTPWYILLSPSNSGLLIQQSMLSQFASKQTQEKEMKGRCIG